MKIELWLIDSNDRINKQKVEVELPEVPRKGECIIVGDTQNYEVVDVIYRFDKELRFTGRISVDALSLWNRTNSA